MSISIKVQTQDFDLAAHYNSLQSSGSSGACVMFTGIVRDFSNSKSSDFYLECYPGMTEKVLSDLAQQAKKRWNLHKISIIHRVGELTAGDQIVFVGVASAHRSEAFKACEFLIDRLKTTAPFWKKEGENWVQKKCSDEKKSKAWEEKL